MSAHSSEFFVARSRGIWRLTLDGAFNGDYRSVRHAAEGADAAAAGLRNQGRTVTFVAPS